MNSGELLSRSDVEFLLRLWKQLWPAIGVRIESHPSNFAALQILNENLVVRSCWSVLLFSCGRAEQEAIAVGDRWEILMSAWGVSVLDESDVFGINLSRRNPGTLLSASAAYPGDFVAAWEPSWFTSWANILRLQG